MHFVDKSTVKVPEKLELYRKTETHLWVGYYKENKKTGKPPRKWRDLSILEVLANLFQHNCGYCGIGTDIKLKLDKKTKSDKHYYTGEVDHYYPICYFPQKVYEWDNYIWSCHDCNSPAGKHNYYDPECLILNPCCRKDTDYLHFDCSRGTYRLKMKFEKDMVIKKRFQITEEKTFMNTDIRIKGRKNLFDRLQQLVKDIERYSLLKDSGIPGITEEYQEKHTNTVNQLIQCVKETTHFKLLVQEFFKFIQTKYKIL